MTHKAARVLWVIGTLVLWIPATQAQTRVSPWQRARDPALVARRLVQELGDHKREPRDLDHDSEVTRTRLHRAAAALLEGALGAELDTTLDVDLLLLYGECAAFAGADHQARARKTLERALLLAPDHPGAASAWNTLGRVRAALGEFESAYEAFERALELEWELATRTEIQVEQGLLAMRHGDLTVAIERLTVARNESDQPAVWALAQWALGVAMDRALLGPEGALLAWQASQGRFGANGELDVLALPGIAPEPKSETTYYRALALVGKAQTMKGKEQVSTLLDAKFLWLSHLQEAGPTGPFAARVHYHLQKIDENTKSPEDGRELDRQALAPMKIDVDAGAPAAEDMIWPEELTRDDFWSGDAGTPSPEPQAP